MKSWSCFCFVLLLASGASAATFRVTTAMDSGPGSLRQAIIDSNATAETDSITVDLGERITLASPLPEVIHPVKISGSERSVLDGSLLASGPALRISADDSSVVRLNFVNFPANGVEVSGASDVLVALNRFGIDPLRSFAQAPIGGTAIQLENALNAQIEANSVGSASRGIHVLSSAGTVVLNNAIGFGAAAVIATDALTIASDSVRVNDNRDCVAACLFGDVLPYPPPSFGYAEVGIRITGNHNMVRLGWFGHIRSHAIVAAGSDNTIVNIDANDVEGDLLRVLNGSTTLLTAEFKRIGGSIVDNGGDGANANDDADRDSGANGLLNHPIVTSASFDGRDLIIRGTIDTAPNTSVTIGGVRRRNCDADAWGAIYGLDTTVVTDDSGHATFSVRIDSGSLSSAAAIARTADGVSELAPCVEAEDASIPTLSESLLAFLVVVLAAIAAFRLR